MQFTIVLISLAAGLVGAVGFTNNPFIHVQRDLERRAVPPCPKCPVSDQDWRSKYKQPQHTEMEASTAATNDKWLPLACSRHGYTCVEYFLIPALQVFKALTRRCTESRRESITAQAASWVILSAVGSAPTVHRCLFPSTGRVRFSSLVPALHSISIRRIVRCTC